MGGAAGTAPSGGVGRAVDDRLIRPCSRSTCRRIACRLNCRYRTDEKRPPEIRLRRKEPYRPRCGVPASGQRRVAPPHRRVPVAWPAVHRGRRSPRPTCTCLSLPRRTRACKGALRARLRGRPLPGAVPARLNGRRFGGWGRRRARDTQHGQAAAYGSPLRCAHSALINGGGCAAASIEGDRMGDASMGTRAAGPAGPWEGTLVACAVTPLPAAVAGRLCAGVPGRRRAVRRLRRKPAESAGMLVAVPA